MAYEQVTVPAGTFMAFRVEFRGSWNITDVRNMKWAGEANDTSWYAPEPRVDVIHRRVSDGRHGSEQWRQELTSYARGPQALKH